MPRGAQKRKAGGGKPATAKRERPSPAGGAGAGAGGGRRSKATLGLPDDGGLSFLEWLVEPAGLSLDEFMADYWERQPLVIRDPAGKASGGSAAGAGAGAGSAAPRRFSDLFSYAHLLELAGHGGLEFSRNVNAVKYEGGTKVSHNPAPGGRAGAGAGAEAAGNAPATRAAVSSLWKKGCTLQFHQPQQYSDGLCALVAKLEAELGCLVGSNVYLTPSGAQGLAPHHDDIEAIVLQVEGSKHWRVYRPYAEELPRSYSRDLEQSEIGEPVLDVVLGPGDALYFPRGWVHQADTPAGGSHSTHVTVSTYQGHAWCDFLRTALPIAVDAAAERVVDLRRGLPPRFLAYTGAALADEPDRSVVAAHGSKAASAPAKSKARASGGSGSASEQGPALRAAFRASLRELLTSDAVVDAMCDAALGLPCDEFAVDFVTSRLPPLVVAREEPAFALVPEAEAAARANVQYSGMPPSRDGDRVRLRDPTMVRLLPGVAGDEEDAEEGDIDPDEWVTVYNSFANKRAAHMLGGGGARGEGGRADGEDDDSEGGSADGGSSDDVGANDGIRRYPASVAPALRRLIASHPAWTRSADLDALCGDDEGARHGLIGGLWADGLLEGSFSDADGGRDDSR